MRACGRALSSAAGTRARSADAAFLLGVAADALLGHLQLSEEAEDCRWPRSEEVVVSEQ